MTSWRDAARPLIAAIIEEIGTEDMGALRAALRDRFPWPPRQHHPYKIWLDEIARQLGTKPARQKPGRPSQINPTRPEPMAGQKEIQWKDES